MKPCARTHIDDIVCLPDRLLVVLDHNESISHVAEFFQGIDQFAVVSLVKPDRGLVEHVEHPGQVGADLGRKSDPLRLAA